MTLDAKWILYKSFSDHRLHFGRIYFQVIGVNLILFVGTAIAIAIGRPSWWDATRALIGFALIATAFVAHRLYRQEERYASALRSIEREEGLVSFSEPKGPHARSLVVVALAVSGCLLAIEGSYRLV